ncbi:MAG: hypothetical protein ACI30B_08685 [Paludibacteraceae bacterium]
MKRKFVNFVLSGTLMCLTTSCASIFCGTKAKVTFDCNVKDGVSLLIDGKKHYDVSFPFTIKIKRGFDDTVVKAEAETYYPETLLIDKKFNPISILNLCDVLGWGIDAATGAITKPAENYYFIEMKKQE